jgi:uncharacterized oligopeptide transporter (OPT) family protein
MLDPYLLWLESTAFSTWMRESTSIFAFPIVLSLHTIGLGLIAGLNVALNLRILGFAPRIPAADFRFFLPLMRCGLWVNVTSGLALLAAYPTKALTNPVFYLKLGFIVVALVILKVVRRHLLIEGVSLTVSMSNKLRILATASLLCWAGAIVAGRLLAYTYTRLMVDSVPRP